MSETLVLENLISRRPARSTGDSEELKKEKQRRLIEYRRYTLQALAKAHPTDYDILYAQAKKYVDNKRGPLPE